jgi:hypothetical protein
MVTYDEHKAWLIRSRSGFQAELDGFTAASYATEPPPFYIEDAALRERFELGFKNGKAMLLAGKRDERT